MGERWGASDNDALARILGRPLHENAEVLVREVVDDFTNSLLLQAKTLAFFRDDDVVTSGHIRHSLEILRTRVQRSWVRDVSVLIGGAFFGTFLQGFIPEMQKADKDSNVIVVYVALAIFGTVLSFYGLNRPR